MFWTYPVYVLSRFWMRSFLPSVLGSFQGMTERARFRMTGFQSVCFTLLVFILKKEPRAPFCHKADDWRGSLLLWQLNYW